MRHTVEPLVDATGKLAMAADADLGKCLEPHFQLGELRALALGLAPPLANIDQRHDGEHEQRENGHTGQDQQHDLWLDGEASDLDRV